jgi:SAM-dependent methyltransferase
MSATISPAPKVAVSFLFEIDETSTCRAAIESLAAGRQRSVPVEVIAVSAGGAGLGDDLISLVDWHLATRAEGPKALEFATSRALRIAVGRWIVYCNPAAELPGDVAARLLAEDAAIEPGERRPVITVIGADSRPAALAIARDDALLIVHDSSADLRFEDLVRLLVLSGAASRRLEFVAPAATLDWRDIPVFVVNRNRLCAMQRLIEWLRAAGTRQIVILDNASSYPPLLRYYESLPEGVKALRMEQNHGPWVLWQQGVHKVLETPFVLTDSDVVPVAACPSDLIARMLEVLQSHPEAKKVGPGLRIDDLPDHYVEADTVRKWESQFWEHPVAPGLFRAPIDTTFALYPPGAEFSNEPCNLRLGAPYLTEHTPWYVDEKNLSDEELHYRANTSLAYSNWSVAKKDHWVARSERVARYDARPRVLHLDGGRQPIPGWINAGREIDFDPAASRAAPLPLPPDSLDGIHLSHVLEGVRDAWPLFEELWRAARPGAKLVVREKHGARTGAWQDSAMQRAWTEGSFAHLAQPAQPAGSGYRADWALESVSLIAEIGSDAPRELVAVLHAVKPGRGAQGRHPATTAVSRLTHDDCFDPAFGPATTA